MAPRHLWSSHQARTVREFQEVRAVLVFDQKFQDKNDYALLKPAKPPRVGKVSDPKSDGRGLESEQKMWFLGPKILRRRLRQKDIGGCLCVLVCASRNSCFQIEEAPHTMRICTRGWTRPATTRWFQALDWFSILTILGWSCDRLLSLRVGCVVQSQKNAVWRDGPGAATSWNSVTWAKMFLTEKRLGTLCRGALRRRTPTFIRPPVLRA